MAYAEASPHPALRSLVQCYWAKGNDVAPHRVLPDGCIDVIVFGHGARVVGAMRRAIIVPPSANTDDSAIGIRFRPGEAARILREAPAELTDADAPLADLWGESGCALESTLLRLGASRFGTPQSVLAHAGPLLDAALMARVRAFAGASDLRIRIATDLLEKGHLVHDVAARVALSERQLGRRFQERVGVSPKVFARVMRLQRAAQAMAKGAPLSRAAAEAGYADHAHFTRDARELAQATPRILAAELRPTHVDEARDAVTSDSFKTPPKPAR